MPLSPGERLSHYALTRQIGEGGMGVVWEAQDSVLDRAVAVKILPEDVAGNPDRLARFEREARLLAALSHPHIGAIHGLEEDRGIRFLVLELIPGETLEEALTGGGLPVPEALELARQIADALEAAHEAGIIHRDLKPANVKVTPEGKAKVLDFGLAKALTSGDPVRGSGASGAAGLSHSPTLTSGGTKTGVILGTAAYMSPEQARGKVVDRRADIWAFGCLLYEMLSGQRPFGGETVTDTLAAVLEREPDWSRLPERAPARIRELLRRCLEKDPRQRLRDMGDARLELEEAVGTRAWSSPAMAPAPAGAGMAVAGRGRARAGAWALAGAALMVGAAAGAGLWAALGPAARDSGGAAEVLRLSVPVPDNLSLHDYEITPDGRTLVIMAHDRSDEKREDFLYVRRLDQGTFERLPSVREPQSWDLSPDGQWVAFIADQGPASTREQVLKARLDGGPAVPLWDQPDRDLENVRWCSQQTLVLALTGAGGKRALARMPADGGAPEIVSPPERLGPGGIDSFTALPDCAGLLVTRWMVGEQGFSYAVDAVPLDGGEHRVLLEDAYAALAVPTGHVVFTRGDALYAAPFDAASASLRGPVFPVTSGLWAAQVWESARFRVSGTGTLAYRPGGRSAGRRTVAVVDRQGQLEPLVPGEHPIEGDLAVSPDGRSLAMVIPDSTGMFQVWVYDLRRQTLRPLPVAGSDCTSPTISWDGRWVAYQVERSGEPDRVDRRRLDGSGGPETILAHSAGDRGFLSPADWSPDGSLLAVVAGTPAETRVLLVPTDGEGEPRPLETGARATSSPAFSPDGAWIAYISDRSGRGEAYVRRLEGGDGEWVVTRDGANDLFWGRDGRAIYVQDERDRLLVAAVRTSPDVEIGPLQVVADGEALGAVRLGDSGPLFDLAPDGKQLAFIRKGEDERTAGRIDLVLNWFTELRQKAPPVTR